MNAAVNELLILATEGAEGLSGDHIASKLAVPLGIVIFCGSVYALLWSNYGAKKGALIYGTALGGFCFMLGIFWWFGAPGTPVATGLQNFPGQANDAYTAKWYPFEPGSERAEYFSSTGDLSSFQTVAESLGLDDSEGAHLETNPKYGAVNGDASGVGSQMLDLFLRVEDGTVNIGGDRRAAYQAAGEAGLADMGLGITDVVQADPFYSAEVVGDVLLTRDDGTLVAGATVRAFVNYEDAEGELISIPVDEGEMFAFKQESNLWFPSAIWTLGFFLIFVISLLALDRMEQREKQAVEEVQEPERLAVPIRQ